MNLDADHYNKFTENDLLHTILDRDRNGLVKVEVKKESDSAIVNIQHPNLDESIHNSADSESNSVYDRLVCRDPCASIHMTDIQSWPKLEFNEAVHEFHTSNTNLPCTIEKLNNEASHNVSSTTNHFVSQKDPLTRGNGCDNMKINVFVKETENVLLPRKFYSDEPQYRLGTHNRNLYQDLIMTDQYRTPLSPVVMSSHSMKEESAVCPVVNTPNNFHTTEGTINTNISKVINAYINLDKGRFACNLCDKKYVDLAKAKGHICSHLGLKPHACTYTDCTKTFPSKEALRSHIYLMHKAHDRFKCELCVKTFNKRSVYEEHCNKHNMVMPFDCAECGKVFPSKDSIFTHIVDVHNASSDDRSILCPHCGKVCANHPKLKCHLRTHSDKRFICDVCNAKFRSRFNLATHKTSHSTERPFQCNLCSKTYRANKTLRRHVVTVHEKKRNFMCSTCGKSFVTGSFLREHQLKHEGIRKYSCETCGKTFAQASHLCAHQFSHGEKKFVCPICGAKFNRHDNMKSHVKRHEKVKN